MGRVIISNGEVFNREAKERRDRPKYKAYDYKEILGNIQTAGNIARQATDVLSSPLVKGLSGSQSPLVKPFRGSPTATPGSSPMDQAVAQRAQAAGNVPFAVNVPTVGGTEAPWSTGMPKAPPPGPSLSPEQKVSIDRGQQVTQAAQTSIQAQQEAQQAAAALAQPQTMISPQIEQPAQPAKPEGLGAQALAALPPVWQKWASLGEGSQPRYITGTNEPILSGVKMPEDQLQHLIQTSADDAAKRYSIDASKLASLATAIVKQETGGFDYDIGAISPTGPVGLWQFTYNTWDSAAKQAGAPTERGGRLDPRISTMVAVDHLGDLLKRAGGDVGKAAAAYHGTSESQITDPEKYQVRVTEDMATQQSAADAPAAEQQVATRESAEVSSQQERVQANPPIEQASIAPPGFEDRETEIRSGTFVVPNVRPDVVSANSLQLMSLNATDQRQKNWVRQLAFEADQKGELNYEFTDYMDLFSGKARDRFMKRLEGGMPKAVKPREPVIVSDLDRSTAELRRAQARRFDAESDKIKAAGPKKKEQKPYDYNGNVTTVNALRDAFASQVDALEKSLKTDVPITVNAFEAKEPISINATQSEKASIKKAWESARKIAEDIRNIKDLRNNENKKKVKSARTRLSRKLVLIEQLLSAIGKSRSDKEGKYAPIPAMTMAWENLFSNTGASNSTRAIAPAQEQEWDRQAQKTADSWGDGG